MSYRDLMSVTVTGNHQPPNFGVIAAVGRKERREKLFSEFADRGHCNEPAFMNEVISRMKLGI
jgi:hypothetical protein